MLIKSKKPQSFKNLIKKSNFKFLTWKTAWIGNDVIALEDTFLLQILLMFVNFEKTRITGKELCEIKFE